MTASSKILCGDWGTSAFRLLLVDPSSAQVIARDQTDQGIAQTFALWQQPENAAIQRTTFYLDYIEKRIARLEKQLQFSLQNTPLILSGMASSSVGLTELPYAALPFAVSGADLNVQYYPPSSAAGRPLFLISGVESKETHEVMRGEETLVVGAAEPTDSWYVLPGTHSKHIAVRNGQATDLKTYMTGEFFDLLSHHSIVRLSVTANDRFSETQMQAHFTQGVHKGLQENILCGSFAVRTNALFHHCTPEENYHFLSGLLIGSELRTFCTKRTTVSLICGPRLHPLYAHAFQTINAAGGQVTVRYLPAEEALIRGQLNLYSFLKQHT